MRYEMLAVFVILAAVAWAAATLPDALIKIFLVAGWAVSLFAVGAAVWKIIF